MIPLNSPRWNELRAYEGLASEVPELLKRFVDSPNEESFYNLAEKLTGDGDMAPSEAFVAAFPYVCAALDRLPREDREPIIGTLAWASALACVEVWSDELSSDFKASLAMLGKSAIAALEDGPRQDCKNYLLAAYAVACDEPIAALALIEMDDALHCPKCGYYIDCAHCGSTLSTRFIVSHGRDG